tara:strand:+ start:63 stop:533 length:471 start_codon:yes stop_codon:yes gene_type:complete
MSGIVGSAGSKSGNTRTTELEYEKGKWSPILKGASSGVSATMTNQGNYVRIGNFVHLQFKMVWGSMTGTMGGNVELHGVPFLSHPDSDDNERGKGSIGLKGSGITVGGGYLNVSLAYNAGYTYIFVIQDSASGYSHTPAVATTGAIYSCEIDYMIA